MSSAVIRCAVTVLAAATLLACGEDPVRPPTDPPETIDTTTHPPANPNPDWTAVSHEKRAPDYSTVFPQQSVSRIDITMTAAQWTQIRASMKEIWGVDFGGAPGSAIGNFPAEDPPYVDVTMRFKGKAWHHVGFRLKGNSSLAYSWKNGIYKLPFRLHFDKFEKQFPEVADQRLYGFKELSMSSGWNDPSLIREKVAADIFRSAGIPAAQTAFYQVFIDFGDGPKYCGLYTMVEVIDDSMIKAQFGSDNGNIYKPESALLSFRESEFEKKNNDGTGYGDIIAFLAALHDPQRLTNRSQWRSGLEATFDVDHFLHWLAVNNAIVNWDSYGTMPQNYYLYNDPAGRLTWIPWDHNLSMGGNPPISGKNGQQGLSLTMSEVTAAWPLIRYLADDSTYMHAYRNHMRSFRDNVFTESQMHAQFDRYTQLIAPYVTGANGEQPGYTLLPSPASFSFANSTLKQHVTRRRALLEQYLQ